MRKVYLLFFIFLLISTNLFSKDSASFRSALRYSQVARSLVLDQEWDNAIVEVEKGLAYEQNLSDLWYIKAMCLEAKGNIKAESIAAVKKSLDIDVWREINPDAARIMYANYLTDSCSANEALGVIDKKPAVFTADAQYIRERIYYILKDFEKAQMVVNSARKLFPDDSRFPLLFFKNEIPNDKNRALATNLLKMLDRWTSVCPEILVYASNFVDNEKKLDMLGKFDSTKVKNLDFLINALEVGLLTDEQIIERIKAYSSEIVDSKKIDMLLGKLSDEQIKTDFCKYLETYSGIMTKDTNNDDIPDLYIEYYLGNVANISYYENQDGIISWSARLKNGIPEFLNLKCEKKQIFYNNFPEILRIIFPAGEDLTLVSSAISWAPFIFQSLENCSADFFTSVSLNPVEFSTIDIGFLLDNISVLETSTNERSDGKIRFTVLDGKILNADYNTAGTKYAYAAFEDGIPLFRNLDSDGDSVFEITEFYEFNEKEFRNFQTETEKRALSATLFGTLFAPEGLYLSKIVADLNSDYINDYFEEYKQNSEKICGWDTDSDGIYDIGFIKKADSSNLERLQTEEEIFYLHPVSKEKVIAKAINGSPVSVKIGEIEKIITKDSKHNLYWIGQVPKTTDFADKVLLLLKQNGGSVVSNIYEKRVAAIKIGTFCFGEIIDEIE